MPGPPSREHANADKDDPQVSYGRNYTLGIASGAIGTISFDFLHAELILAGLIYALTGSTALVALVTVISKGGILAPQLLVGTRLEHRPWKRPYYIGVAVVRVTAMAGMIASIPLMGMSVNAWTLSLFFGAYLLVALATGAGYVIFMDMVGRMIPTGRIGSFIGLRQFLGGALSIVLGYVLVQPVLTKVSVPSNYFVLAVIGGVAAIMHATLFGLCREPAGPSARKATTLGESLRRGFKWLRRDRNYRIFMGLRVLFRVNYLSLAFFIPYGSDRLAIRRYAPGSAEDVASLGILGGIMIATFKLSRTLFSAIWGRVADRRGYRPCLVGAGACFLLAPALALLAPALRTTFAVRVPFVPVDLDLPLCVYFSALLVLGAAFQGTIIGSNRFLIANAPPHRRISYVGFLNTVTCPLTLLPLAGAWLADAIGKGGLGVLFGIILAAGAGYLLLAMRMGRTDRSV